MMSDIDERFTAVCSSKTVQADENGFFESFYCAVVESFENKSEWKNFLINVFGKCESDREKLQLLYEDPSVSWIVFEVLGNVTEVYRKKDAIISFDKRGEVERLLNQYESEDKSVCLDKMLIIASQAIMRAPMKGFQSDWRGYRSISDEKYSYRNR